MFSMKAVIPSGTTPSYIGVANNIWNITGLGNQITGLLCRSFSSLSNERLINTKSKQSVNIYSLSEEALYKELNKSTNDTGHNNNIIPMYRIKQIREWYLKKGCNNFKNMINLPLSLRDKLNEDFNCGNMNIKLEKISKDGTIKRVYSLTDGMFL